ncbi:glycosyltransferase family 69 protein [Cenococcum geophilum 1.58]|uniref:glycosyltransferase family 69 protein n=1 Tax=Cenococcum geophilum 1.58 TaxID=794803 RepID=UPI00358DEEC8|nr:glycosyltransferase family 69 protein [Cenococcum geophilum 1.58]
MAPRFRRSEEYELLPRVSSDSIRSSSNSDLEHHGSTTTNIHHLRLPAWLCIRLPLRPARALYTKLSGPRGPRRPLVRGICWMIAAILCVIILLVVFTAAFRPSYTHLPDHYGALQRRCRESHEPGRGNINNEKVFIAATLYDPKGLLVGGDWGSAVLKLVELLGPENVYLSVYENDADPLAKASLETLEKRLTCNSSLISEHLPLEEIPRVTVPSGERRMKRIAFLAEVRNRALRPLEANLSVRFDKLLFINDVMFNPVDAAHLLFSTNIDSSGHTQYGAVCAVDFINAFKFYDRFATRDLEGYAMGIPFFPWFTDAGNAVSRRDVLEQKDAVRVRACWGGMTAFEAKWFQSSYRDNSLTVADDTNFAASKISPLRFRYEEDPFWDASECCLIHADLTYLRYGRNITTDSGIFTNPYIRVAYDSRTLSWLPYTRRIERLYSFIHNLLNHAVGLPSHNVRRLEQPGDTVVEKVWKYDDTGEKPKPGESGSDLKGSYHDVKRVVSPGRFCGSRTLLVLNDNPKEGEKKWMNVPLPALPS